MKRIIIGAAVSFILGTSSVYAATVSQSLSVTANITDTSGDFTILPATGSWPSQALVIGWNSTTKSFENPSGVGIRISSTEDVTAALTSAPKLTNGLAEIPMTVTLTATGTNGVTKPLTMTPESVYLKTTNPTKETANYTIDIAGNTTGMKDTTGTVVTPGGTPSSGSYAGTVGLIFESAI